MKKIFVGAAALLGALLIAFLIRGALAPDREPAGARADSASLRTPMPDTGAIDVAGGDTALSAASDSLPASRDRGFVPLPGAAGTGGSAPGGKAGGTTQQTPTPPTASTQDALAIVRRTAQLYQGVQSMSASFVQTLENPLLGSRTTSRGVLYQRRPDRIKLDFSQPDGDVIVGDGRYFWVYYPSVDAKQVIRAPAGPAGAPGGVDLQAQFVGDPGRRFTVTSVGREQVGGRPATVLLLVPREELGYRRMKIWVDDGDNLVRRFEIEEKSDIVRRFDLSDLRINPRIPDNVFRFTPPAQAQVVDRG